MNDHNVFILSNMLKSRPKKIPIREVLIALNYWRKTHHKLHHVKMVTLRREMEALKDEQWIHMIDDDEKELQDG